jgi:hypothetical protein
MPINTNQSKVPKINSDQCHVIFFLNQSVKKRNHEQTTHIEFKSVIVAIEVIPYATQLKTAYIPLILITKQICHLQLEKKMPRRISLTNFFSQIGSRVSYSIHIHILTL